MNRSAGAILLLLLPLSLGASRLATHVTLNSKGQGEVTINIETNMDDLGRLKYLDDTGLEESVLVRELVASPLGLRELLKQRGFNNVTVEQSLKANNLSTVATAHMDDVQALLGHGGVLTFSEAPGSFLDLKGSLGGGLAGSVPAEKLVVLKEVAVTLTFQFAGTVRKADAPGKISRAGDSVAYSWTGDELLGKTTPVDVRVVPDIEETPFFWLVLILGITGVVAVGVVIVLQRGRGALGVPDGK
jgi:hypothetical protein